MIAPADIIAQEISNDTAEAREVRSLGSAPPFK
jgi:hypothetical protein